jgi:hypothetical protein
VTRPVTVPRLVCAETAEQSSSIGPIRIENRDVISEWNT